MNFANEIQHFIAEGKDIYQQLELAGVIDTQEWFGPGKPTQATKNELKKTWGPLALNLHTDKGGERVQFQDTKNAYKILDDDNSRNQYNAAYFAAFGFTPAAAAAFGAAPPAPAAAAPPPAAAFGAAFGAAPPPAAAFGAAPPAAAAFGAFDDPARRPKNRFVVKLYLFIITKNK